ncbi:MAG: hypothetical protein R3C56_05900 [Pirellulaceae bacterium]
MIDEPGSNRALGFIDSPVERFAVFDFATPIELDFARPNDHASAGDKPVFTFFMGVTR